MKALSTFLRRDVEVIGAGRTDAGVHASLMVAHFDHEDVLDTVTVADKLNRLLPPDISVYRVRQVKPDAHARFDATARNRQNRTTWSRWTPNAENRRPAAPDITILYYSRLGKKIQSIYFTRFSFEIKRFR